jgi:hypothetical protein
MYSAVSIIEGLKASKQIVCEGIDDICCPRPESSCEKRDDCVTGAGQECKQAIKVYRDYKLLIVLAVRFKVAPDRCEGFIRKGDSSLTQMVNHGYLDKSLLKMA